MTKSIFFAIAAICLYLCAGCGPGEVTASDQKAMEAKYNEKGYEDAMAKAGRQKELDDQKRLNEERNQDR